MLKESFKDVKGYPDKLTDRGTTRCCPLPRLYTGRSCFKEFRPPIFLRISILTPTIVSGANIDHTHAPRFLMFYRRLINLEMFALYITLLATLEVGPLRGTEVGLKARRSCKFSGKFGFLYPGRRSPSGIHAGCGFNPPKIFIFAGLKGLLSNNCCSSFNCFASINSFAGTFANGSVDIPMHLSSSA